MKLGSVKFFKRLIVGVFIFLLLLPVALAVMFGYMYFEQRKMAEGLEALSWALVNNTPLPEDVQLPPALMQQVPATLKQQVPNEVVQQPAGLEASFAYQTRYPHLYAERAEVLPEEGKVCYLTFDDGPSPVTAQVLETLAEYDVKATFFVTGANSLQNTDILKQAAEAGHTIGVHTYSHEYEEIYASVDAFLEDFEKMYSYILEVTGQAPTVFRFAGGSVNEHNQTLYREIVAEMVRRGFVFYDWNAAASDAVSGGITSQQVLNNVLSSAAGRDRAIVLMHDRNDNASTAAALASVIEGLAGQGYSFAPLTNAVVPITFYYD